METQDNSISKPATEATYNVATMPLRPEHYWIVTVASLGQLIGTTVATIAGVIIPLLNIVLHPELSGFMQGVIGASDLLGICIGSVIFGRLSDRYGYLFFFRFCPLLIFVASTASIFLDNVAVLTVCLFIIGLGIGGEYSLDSDYVADLIPDRYKSLMVGLTKTASALGNIIAAAICFGLIMLWKDAQFWSRLMWIVSAIAALMFVLRIRFYQSPGWLMSKGRVAEAEEALHKFLGNDVTMTPKAPQQPKSEAPKTNLFRFVTTNWRKVVVSGLPWACEGLGVYGIGVFLPILIMALGLEHFTPGESNIFHVAYSVRVTLYISCIMLPGFLVGLWLINKGKRITAIQTWGFLLCMVSLCVLMPAYELHWNKWIAIGAFMAFEFFLNMGPHLITYVMPPHIYEVSERGQGVGIAAAVGKIGAVLAVFIIPILLQYGGALLVLGVSAGVMAIGAAITFMFRKTVINQPQSQK